MSRATNAPLSDYVRRRLDLIAEPTSSAVREQGGPVLNPADIPTRITPPRERTAGWLVPAAEHTVVGAHPAQPVEESPLPEDDTPDAADATEPEASGLVDRLRGWGFDRRHLKVLGVLAAIAVVVSVYLVLRAKPVPVSSPEAAAVVTASAAPSPSESPEPKAEHVTVHVVGAVKKPGVVRLAGGARVIDAIEAAGGLTDDARPGDLNLAQPVGDGQQVVIGSKAAPGGEVRQPSGGSGAEAGGTGAEGGNAGQSGQGQKVNLNTATQEQLETLPGVGPKTAEKILAWRKEHGRFTRIEELQEVPGIGAKTFAELSPHVTV